jgi:benzoyl-CoA reductase/2-hydroxyglutaryl-CoA dehydratase subunit BcrC/BadD/HgdB
MSDPIGIKEFCERIEQEGASYTVLDYYDWENIANEELRDICRRYNEVHQELVEFLGLNE